MLLCSLILTVSACDESRGPSDALEKKSSKAPLTYLCKDFVAGPDLADAQVDHSKESGTDSSKSPADKARSFFASVAKYENCALSKVSEISMEKAFGRSVVSSSYLLFEASLLRNGVEKKSYALSKKDGSSVFEVSSCSQFNKLVDSLDRGVRSKPDALIVVRIFLLMTGATDGHDVIIERKDELSEKQLASLEKWFASHPDHRLTNPIFVKRKYGLLVSFLTWRKTSGLLRRHVIKLDPKGRVMEYTQEQLGDRVGSVEKI